MANIAYSDLLAELNSLHEASLITKSKDSFHPSFLVVDSDETTKVRNHASELGLHLAEIVQSNWNDIESVYSTLSFSEDETFSDMAFMLVGSRLLDIAFLEEIASQRILMPPAPKRPSPDRPDAQYYFWMVEGSKEDLGEYGQNSTDLPIPKWAFLTFAQNIIDGEPNPHRMEISIKYKEIVKQCGHEPLEIGRELSIPVIDRDDVSKWTKFAKEQASHLHEFCLKNKESIDTLFAMLKVGTYSPQARGEFFCWYAHLLYSGAIDVLERNSFLTIPKSRCSGALWYKIVEREGVEV